MIYLVRYVPWCNSGVNVMGGIHYFLIVIKVYSMRWILYQILSTRPVTRD